MRVGVKSRLEIKMKWIMFALLFSGCSEIRKNAYFYGCLDGTERAAKAGSNHGREISTVEYGQLINQCSVDAEKQ